MSISRSNSLPNISMNSVEERPPSPLSEVDASVQQATQRALTPNAEACQTQSNEQQRQGSYAYSILSAPTNIAAWAASFVSIHISSASSFTSQVHNQEIDSLAAPLAGQRMNATTCDCSLA